MSTSQAVLDFTSDTVPVVRNQSVALADGTTQHLKVPVEITLDELHQRLFTDPTGLQEVRIDQTFDLTDLDAAYVAVAVIPAGSKVKRATIQILTTVEDDGTGDSLGLGTHGTTPALLLQGAADLTQNYQLSKIPVDANAIIASQTTIDLCATVNADGSLSDGVITAGSVRVLLVYDTPAILSNV
jgi:hypothetical protein